MQTQGKILVVEFIILLYIFAYIGMNDYSIFNLSSATLFIVYLSAIIVILSSGIIYKLQKVASWLGGFIIFGTIVGLLI